jgi:hypothetical protein
MPISHKHSGFVYPDYISPLPADELIRVGTIKQQLYSEGVAKVQNEIDTLDQYGFSILKEEDKKYFTQEMDKFMKTLNEGAAKTDFANMNSLKDLLSVGKPLENDPYILNAIQSSAEVKRRQQALSSMKPEERSAANDFDFMSEAYDYLSDKRVGAKISNAGKAYTPYINLSKKYMEVVDKIKPETTQVPEFVNGRWIVTTKTEELSAARLNEAFEASLDEAGRNQLRIDTKYDVYARGKENVAGEYVNSNLYLSQETARSIQATQADIDATTRLLQKYPDPATKQDLENKKARLQELEIRQRIYSTNATKTLDDISEADLIDFHKNKFISNLSNAYSYRNVEQDIKADPYGELAVRHSYDVAMENLRTLNNLEVEREKEMMERVKGKDLITTGAGFLSLFNPDTKVENYAEKVSNKDGSKYLFDQSPENIKKWETAHNKYNSATNTLDKLKALRTLVGDFAYDSKKVTGLAETKDLKNNDIILDSRKQKAYGVELLNNLISSYDKIQKYANNPSAQIKVTFPDGLSEVISAQDFLGRSFDDLIAPLSGADKVELYAGDNKQDLFKTLKTYQELTKGTTNSPAAFKASPEQMRNYLRDQGYDDSFLGKYIEPRQK